jgi:Ca2+-transporting ATPase
MVVLLLGSSILSFVLDDVKTAAVLFILVLFNTTIGFFQEYKAGKVMESLEKLVVDHASAMRDGKLVETASADLVLGDVVYVEEGNSVPADIRLLSEEELKTNDFALTGESNPTRKFIHAISANLPLSGRQNLCFMGTTVATGHGYGVVVATGMQTELGRIASLSQDIKVETSPLQREMNNIAKRVTQGTMVLCLLLLPVAINIGLPFREAFLFAIGIACSIIPNGLPAAISTSLAGAAGKLARARALVKKLSAVETLGATNIILTDKTGTLTKNQMTVENFLIGKTSYTVTGSGYEAVGDVQDTKGKTLSKAALKELDLFFATGAMASNARVNPPDDDHAVWYCLGDPTEGATVTLAAKAGLDPAVLDQKYPELKEFSFDSARKRMSSFRKYNGKQIYMFVKGAPESVLEQSTEIWDHGHTRKLAAKDRNFLLKHNDTLAATAMRNLGFAYRVFPAGTKLNDLHIENAEKELTWLGMVSMIDPLREEVPAAMEAARGAHIKVSIITGDNAITARAIAIRAKLTEKPEDIAIISGEELTGLSDTQIVNLVQRGGAIFSRVAPEDKLRIVQLVKDSGKVVAVTGDGINDAPALKRADIGVAMGKTGTDVAKQSAEIILLDDSFNTLVGAVKYGRVIFQNIKKAAMCCFTGNAAELMVNLFSLAAATIFQIPLGLTVIQILAIDVIAELFPVAALGGDKADRDIMHESPRNTKEHILNLRSLGDIMWTGTLIGGLAFANYIWFYSRNNINPQGLAADSFIHLKATALTYVTLILCLLVNVLLRRTDRGLFTRYQLHNKSLWLAMGLSLFCVANIVYNPWLTSYFHTAPLSFFDIMTAVGAMAIFIAAREFQRYNKLHHRSVVLSLHRDKVAKRGATIKI